MFHTSAPSLYLIIRKHFNSVTNLYPSFTVMGMNQGSCFISEWLSAQYLSLKWQLLCGSNVL